MKQNQIKIAQLVLDIIYNEDGKCNIEKLSNEFENAGFDFYDGAYQANIHIINVLEKQDIINTKRENLNHPYFFELTDKGYHVSKQGYANWLKERNILENLKNKKIKASFYGQIISITIAVIALANSLYSSFQYKSDLQDIENKIKLMQYKQNQNDNINNSEFSSPINDLIIRDSTKKDTIQ
ncbi:hypothetical protein [Marivirga sp.]|uniref:hypothetical protein n=1 Tax=Marivirga sp. TaxID=2018662 RepID=UPI003DA6EEEA